MSGTTPIDRLFALAENDMRFGPDYSEEDALRDYLAVRPECDPADALATLAGRIYSLHRIWGESC